MIKTDPASTPPQTKTNRIVMRLTCVAAMIGLLTSTQSAWADQAVEQFARAFKAAYETRNATALKGMLYLKGTPDMKQSIKKEAVVLPKGEKVLSLEVVAAKPSDRKSEILNGNAYVPNIKVLNRIDVKIGQGGGSYGRYFVVGRTPSGKMAIGGIKPAGKFTPWKVPAGAPKPKTAEAFVKTWKAAYNSGDGKTIAKMYYFKGTPDDLAGFTMLFAEPSGSITSVELAPHVDRSKTINGKTYVANATNLRLVKFSGNRSSGSFSIGKTPGGYYAISNWKRKSSQTKSSARRKVSSKRRNAFKRKYRARRKACGGRFMYRKGRKCVDARS